MSLSTDHIPHHIALIPDGNRRWAKKNKSSTTLGHREGANNITEIVRAARDFGVKVITIYAFSTENWDRPKLEVKTLMRLLKSYLTEQRQPMVDSGIRLRTVGDLNPLPEGVLNALNDTLAATADCSAIEMVLAINYGSRDEIKRAFQEMLDDYVHQKLHIDKVDEQTIARYLDTKEWPDPDLLIRTSGEQRVSNFLLWQIAYTEIYTSPVLWPDFTVQHLKEAILAFQERKRRKGV